MAVELEVLAIRVRFTEIAEKVLQEAHTHTLVVVLPHLYLLAFRPIQLQEHILIHLRVHGRIALVNSQELMVVAVLLFIASLI